MTGYKFYSFQYLFIVWNAYIDKPLLDTLHYFPYNIYTYNLSFSAYPNCQIVGLLLLNGILAQFKNSFVVWQLYKSPFLFFEYLFLS
jgi:hypothetical protein